MDRARYAGKVRIVLTNDDGIDAPGIASLAKALESFGEVWIFAPAAGVSSCGHGVSEGAFRVFQLGPRRYAVDGKPADCTRVAMHLLKDSIDWVFSGINDGGNLGVDVYYSGTVAGVREAAFRGIPAVAFSHYKDRPLREKDWLRAANWAQAVIPQILERSCPPGGFWNVNFPCPLAATTELPEIVECALEEAPLPLDYLVEGDVFRYHGRYARRARSAGSDVQQCFAGNISVSYLHPFPAGTSAVSIREADMASKADV